MDTPYLKANLIAELAKTVGMSKRKADFLLTLLAQIAYREAPTGFTLPGICKLDVVHRNPRRVRIPRTGELIIIGAHDSLRVRLLRKAKHAVTPMHPGLVQYVHVETPAVEEATPVEDVSSNPSPADASPNTLQEPVPAFAPAAPAQGSQPDPAPVPSVSDVQPVNNDSLVSFRCAACGQEIEAPFDMAGTASECPACSGLIEVPYISEPGTIWGRALPNARSSLPPAGEPQTGAQLVATQEAMKSRTIRIELPDDI